MKSQSKSLIAAFVLSAATAAWAEPAVTNRATNLQAKAEADAATLANLPESTKVEALAGKSGPWREVNATGKTGWVRLMHLRFEGGQGAAASGSANPGGALASLLTGGRTSNSATVTTGIKGLTADNVKEAQPNPTEFKKMESYAASKAGVQSFSQRSKLAATKVEYLNSPAPARTESNMMTGG